MSSSLRSDLMWSMLSSSVSSRSFGFGSQARMLEVSSLKTRKPRSPLKSGVSAWIFFPARRRRSLVSSAILRGLPSLSAAIFWSLFSGFTGQRRFSGPYSLDLQAQGVGREYSVGCHYHRHSVSLRNVLLWLSQQKSP